MTDPASIPLPLLVFAWRHGLFDREALRTRSGERVAVIDPGQKNTDTAAGPQFLGAEVRIGERTCVGSVAVHQRASDWGYNKRNYDPAFDGVILQVVAEDDRLVRKVNDTILPAVALSVPERLIRAHEALQAGVSTSACGYHITRTLSDIEFKAACTRLMIDRLERKYNDILAIYQSVEKNWYETFHVLLFRTMGLGKNKDTYMSLARSVPYAKLCLERGEVENIEAMLFGVAGLLDTSLYDAYKSMLSDRFETLRHRHQLRVLTYCQWSDKGVRPFNFAPKRIAELAALINGNYLILGDLLECQSVDEVRRMFRIELPEYWKRSFSFGTRSEKKQNAIGEDTLDILVINLIVPLLFAYGRQKDRPELEERAIDFLYETKAEKNRYTEGWKLHGVRIEHALASQALIQLSTEYCASGRCTECFLGKRVLRNTF
ncbi:MAG: DUF2851 family protein [Rikenellaceae bacterium]|jgi:hypothetical protein|nr:DUF2851 family protein [Rikenellaceae bacterium]